MNDPWNSLVDGLAGRLCPTPSSWAHRRVHRMCDDAPLAPAAHRRPVALERPAHGGFAPLRNTPLKRPL